MKNATNIERELAAAEKAVTAQEEEKSTRQKLKGTAGKAIAVIAVCFSLFPPSREKIA